MEDTGGSWHAAEIDIGVQNTAGTMMTTTTATMADIPSESANASMNGNMSVTATGSTMSADILEGPKLALSALLRQGTTPQQAREIGICLNCGNTALCPCCDTHCDRCGVKIGEVGVG
jgi:hypothetical protein